MIKQIAPYQRKDNFYCNTKIFNSQIKNKKQKKFSAFYYKFMQ